MYLIIFKNFPALHPMDITYLTTPLQWNISSVFNDEMLKLSNELPCI